MLLYKFSLNSLRKKGYWNSAPGVLLLQIAPFFREVLFVPRLTKWGRGTIDFAIVFPSVRPSVNLKGGVHIWGKICPRSDPGIAHMKYSIDPLELIYKI